MNRAQRRQGIKVLPSPETVTSMPVAPKSAERLRQLAYFASGAEAAAQAALQTAQVARQRTLDAINALVEAGGGDTSAKWNVDFVKMEIRLVSPQAQAPEEAATEPL